MPSIQALSRTAFLLHSTLITEELSSVTNHDRSGPTTSRFFSWVLSFTQCVLHMKFKRSLPLNVTKDPPLLLSESVQSRFLTRKYSCLLLLLLSFFFHFYFVFHSLPDYILCGEQDRLAKHYKYNRKIKVDYLIFLIAYPLVLISHLFLAPFNIASRTTPFFLILGHKFLFGKGVKALERQKCFTWLQGPKKSIIIKNLV